MRRILLCIFLFIGCLVNAQCWKMVVAGETHSLGVKRDGTLWAWGNNDYGQLGDGTKNNSLVPQQIGVGTYWTYVAIGGKHSFALSNFGELYAWGKNDNGQLGYQSTNNSDYLFPRRVGTGTWKSVAAGHNHSLGLSSDGYVYGWGENIVGQLGNASLGTKVITPTRIGLDVGQSWNIKSIYARADTSYLIDSNYRLYGSGRNDNAEIGQGTTSPFYNSFRIIYTDSGRSNWKTVSPGIGFVIGLKLDGKINTWGNGTYGRLGNGTVSGIVTRPALVSGSDAFFAVAAGSQNAFALRNDGQLLGCGSNSRLGIGIDFFNSSYMTVLKGVSWESTGLGLSSYNNTLALKHDGEMCAWGDNANGELGDGTTKSYNLTDKLVYCPLSVKVGKNDVVCPGEDNGEIRLTPNGRPPYKYTWTPNVGDGPTVSGLKPGIYRCRVSDLGGIFANIAVEIKLLLTEIPPLVAKTKNITAQLDASGKVTVNPQDLNDGSFPCAFVQKLTFSLDKSTFDCSNVGPNNVLFTVKDIKGQSATAPAIITVVDNDKPLVKVKDIKVSLDATGKATIKADDVNDGSSDNCAIASMSLDKTSFDCSNIGVNDVILTVTDTNGNSESATAKVTIEGQGSSDIKTKDITITLDAQDKATITVTDINDGSTDICGIASLSLDKTSFDCSNIGPNTVTLTLTDQSGNKKTGTAIVTVVEKKIPIAKSKDITVNLDTAGKATITPADINDGSSDNCGTPSLTLDKTSFDCTNVGTNNVVLTVTDASGNSSTATSKVTINDNLQPIAKVKDISVDLDASGNATITPGDIDDGSSDNCQNFTLSLDKTSFDCSNVGANNVVLTVVDASGNSSTATAKVTVLDNLKPIVKVKDITVSLDATGNVSITPGDIDDGSSDNCGSPSFTLDKTSFDCSNIGVNNVVLTVTDASGNSSTATAKVTVVDNLKPIVKVKDITVELDATGKAIITPSDINDGSSDNCQNFTLSLDKTDFDCTNVGVNKVELTVTDVSGNSSAATAKVTVVDNLKPIAKVKDITVLLDATGNVSITPGDIDDGSSDNCGSPTLSLDKTDFDCSNVGVNNVVLTVTDASGNSSAAIAKVTVVDNLQPIVKVKDITVSLDATGNVSITPGDIDDGSSDNCGSPSFTLDKTSFDCSNIGVNNVVLTVTDASGNSSTATAKVTVVDNLQPIVKVKDISVDLDASGIATITPSDINDGSSDNCQNFTLSLDKTDFDCTNVGVNKVELTVTDVSGNSSTAAAKVTVVDNLKPIAKVKDITVSLAATGNVSITPGDIDDGSSDNCGSPSFSLDKTSFDCTNLGVNNVVLTVTDASGNSSTATAKVTVVDNLKPIVKVKDITVELDATGKAIITPSDINDGSSDNCQNFTLSLDKTDFDCSNVGVNNVVLTVTDASGNSSTATSKVTVVDNLKPIAKVKDISVDLDASGIATIAPSDINDGSSDNCQNFTLSLDNTSFDCTNVGVTNVVLTVTDASGNSSTATAKVTVVDNLKPIAKVKDLTVELDASGIATITPGDIDDGSSDNCQNFTLSLDKTSFDCTNVGVNNVVLTVTDASGNSSTATAKVTVVDNLKPIVKVKDISVELDATGKAIIIPSDINDGSSDNCKNFTLSLDKTNFDCTNVGVNNVVLTTTDASGNSSTATAKVTVVDKLKPIVKVKDITVELDATGNASITPADIDDGTSDNCGIDRMSLENTSFDCANVGVNNVVFTVTDSSGNSSKEIVKVTVVDNVSPIARAKVKIIALDAQGKVTITPTDVDNGSTDNCAIASMSLDKVSFDCSNAGDNQVVLTVIDVHGNRSQATAIVTVWDNLRPIIKTKNITVSLDNSGKATITPAAINDGSSDNCQISSLSLDKTIFDCSNIGPNKVILTLTDPTGNSEQASAIVTVVDETKPIPKFKDITIALDASGKANISVMDINDGSLDNCGIDRMSLDKTSFDCSNLGDNKVSFTLIDVNGNTEVATVKVTVVDLVKPLAKAKDITIELDASGNAAITADEVDDGSSDNCGIASKSLDKSTFDCSNEGVVIVKLLVTDTSGNNNSTTLRVNVVNSFADTDSDGLKNNCDQDDDNDGVLDEKDNCPLVSNPDQADNDKDGIGDICDEDDDNDGIKDGNDNCPITYNPGQEDRDRDGIGNVCDLTELNITEAITPNGDGINDVWVIYNIENYPNSVVQVFNRWGNKVFYARNYQNDWNGSFNGANKSLPDGGSYYYMIDREGDGVFESKGWLYIKI